MRSTRLRKFRRQFPAAFFMVKLLLIWYLAVFSISYLTSGTAAKFFDTKETESAVKAGFWADGWDGSSLTFIEKGNTNIKTCDPVEIKTQIQNSGEGDMMAGSTYDIYYIENGNPEKHGEKLHLPDGEGNIPALMSGDSTEITYLAQNPGVYAFLAHQPEGYSEGETIWSKWVIVNCPPGKAEQDIETGDITETDTEKEQSPDTQAEEESTDADKNKANPENEAANTKEDEETVNETETTEGDGDMDETEATEEAGGDA